uniref:Uncharacterized protein n=1 Tax=Rangifer tarandus platyrhynchus TaxID=3082113 RepID=A0ACB0FHG0_RANTA|nr:unnamed protein product [Rangifer tarandus platyrhynchus]
MQPLPALAGDSEAFSALVTPQARHSISSKFKWPPSQAPQCQDPAEFLICWLNSKGAERNLPDLLRAQAQRRSTVTSAHAFGEPVFPKSNLLLVSCQQASLCANLCWREKVGGAGALEVRRCRPGGPVVMCRFVIHISVSWPELFSCDQLFPLAVQAEVAIQAVAERPLEWYPFVIPLDVCPAEAANNLGPHWPTRPKSKGLDSWEDSCLVTDGHLLKAEGTPRAGGEAGVWASPGEARTAVHTQPPSEELWSRLG